MFHQDYGGLEIQSNGTRFCDFPVVFFFFFFASIINWGDNPFKVAKSMPSGEVVAFPPCEVIKPLFDDIHHQLAPQSDHKDK